MYRLRGGGAIPSLNGSLSCRSKCHDAVEGRQAEQCSDHQPAGSPEQRSNEPDARRGMETTYSSSAKSPSGAPLGKVMASWTTS
jgi:hypothetical protein